MRIIAVTNQKGGVGKTTTVVNLGGALAEKGRKVILMDLDPQAHLTSYMGVDITSLKHTSYDVLRRSATLQQVLMPIRGKIQLLPAGLELAAAEQELVSVVGRETILRDAIGAYEQQADYLFMDCPPSMGLLTLNALSAVREVFIPVQPHFLSLQGLSHLLESILLVHKRINRDLRVTGLLFCMYDGRTSLAGEIARDIETFFTHDSGDDCPWRDIRIFDTRIRGNIKLAESPSYGQTIYEYAPYCHGAEDYMALAEEVEAMTAQDITCAVPEENEPWAQALEKEQAAADTQERPPTSEKPDAALEEKK